VYGNPVTLTDPTGQSPLVLPIIVAAGSACYGVYKFASNTVRALDKGDEYRKQRDARDQWIRDGMNGNPPVTQDQLQEAHRDALQETNNAAAEGGKLSARMLQRAGSLLRGVFGKW
jgi:hypothetical protein